METSNLEKSLSELVDINLKHREVQEEESLHQECHKWIGEVDETVFEMKTKVCTWLRDQTKSSRSSGSKRSGRSSKRSNHGSRRACKYCESFRSKDSQRTSSKKHSDKSVKSNHSGGGSTESIKKQSSLSWAQDRNGRITSQLEFIPGT